MPILPHNKTKLDWKAHTLIAVRFYWKNFLLGLSLLFFSLIIGTIAVLIGNPDTANVRFQLIYMATFVILNMLTLPLQGKWMKQAVEKTNAGHVQKV